MFFIFVQYGLDFAGYCENLTKLHIIFMLIFFLFKLSLP